MRAVAVLLSVLMALAACASPPPKPPSVEFTRVDLPAAAVALAVDGDALLVGTRRDDGSVLPGLLRLTPTGSTEIPLSPATPYGNLATWQSIVAADGRIVAIGGERGGAHGNVRWSAWAGTVVGVGEKRQGFSTFGGYGAGELIAAVVTPSGPTLVGSWNSEQAGLDVATWSPDGDWWVRTPSAGTALESTQTALGFPSAATSLGAGIIVTGSRIVTDAAGTKQIPTAWMSTSGATGWTMTPLPDGGTIGAALAVRCWAARCAATGRVDGKLAMWVREADGQWRRERVPDIAVDEKDTVAPPVEVDGVPTLVVDKDGGVWVVRGDRMSAAGGPSGPVTATALVGGTLYAIAGSALWRIDAMALG